MELTRRRLLSSSLYGAGLLGLRSLATGIPISILANPRQALARDPQEPPKVEPQYFILSTSGEGDPLNANAPGSYLNPQIGHPNDPRMAPTPLTLGGRQFTAALPWSTLPQALLDRSCFFHHATYTEVHADESKVLALGDNTVGGEMFASLLASQLAPRLGTLQADPIVLGPRQTSEDLFYDGHPEPIVSPSALAALLAPPTGKLERLVQLRDKTLDKLNAMVRSEGNPGKTAFIDQYARSQTEVRALSRQLLSSLARIRDDSPASQVTAAVILMQLKISPVVSLNIPFGGDNHGDSLLQAETEQTVAGVSTIGRLWTELVAAGLQDRVSFLSLNVFGRTLSAQTSSNGRSHNANHHVALMLGAPFKGSVVGGVEPVEGDFGAMSIASATGAGVPDGKGDIPLRLTFQSMARTFGTAVGVDPGLLAAKIPEGTAVLAALADGSSTVAAKSE